MQLYFSPLACSMSSRIALYEAGAEADFIEVDSKLKRTLTGEDFYAINPLGLVPALRSDHGGLLFENAAILQYIADAYPQSAIAAPTGFARAVLQQWLSFIGTELHKALFIPLFDSALSLASRDKVLVAGRRRLDVLQAHLLGREFLLDRWSVADAYLTTVLNWHAHAHLELASWPAVQEYFGRMCERPATRRALLEEHALYVEEQHRRKVSA